MKLQLRTAVAAAALLAASSALAAAAFPSFNGTNGNGGFSYGCTDGGVLTAFTGTGRWALNGPSTCLHADFGNLPQASVGGSYPTVSVPSEAVLLHPGNADNLSVYAAYLANSTGNYSYVIDLKSVAIDTTSGVGYTPFTYLNGAVALGTRGLLPTYGSSATLSGTQALVAGQSFGVIMDPNGFMVAIRRA
ncbi:MAG: hypothetical protein JWQ16_1335 [Novosphingobium sp.]|nr:hypothetical protein [Novosphingobium sp.]